MLHIANMKQWFHVYLTLSSATHCKQQDTRQIDHFQVLDFELELSSLASPWCNEVVSKGKNLLRNKINFFFSFFLDARPYSVLIILHSFFNCFRWSQITHNEIFKTRLDNRLVPLYFPEIYIANECCPILEYLSTSVISETGFICMWIEKSREHSEISHFVWSRGSPRRRAVLKTVVPSFSHHDGVISRHGLMKPIDTDTLSKNESRLRRVSWWKRFL